MKYARYNPSAAILSGATMMAMSPTRSHAPAAYLHGRNALHASANGRNIRLRMDRLAAPFVDAFWFNPRNGQWRVGDSELADQIAFMGSIPSGPAAPVQEFDPPDLVGEGNDWVLVLTTAK